MGANVTCARSCADYDRCWLQHGDQEGGNIILAQTVCNSTFNGNNNLENCSPVVMPLTSMAILSRSLQKFTYLESEDTESTRSSTTVLDQTEVKATMASRVLRILADSDYQRAWERLRYEFECQKVLWGVVEKMDRTTEDHGMVEKMDSTTQHDGKTPRALNPSVRDGIIAALTSKVELALAMASDCDVQAIYALEALLSLNDTMAKQLSVECAEAASSALSPSLRARAEEILEMEPVKQARNDLADYLDEVAANEHARFARAADWAPTTVKACELRHGVLKEYISEVIVSDGNQRLAIQRRLRFPSAIDDQLFV